MNFRIKHILAVVSLCSIIIISGGAASKKQDDCINKTVSAKQYNSLLEIRSQITGHKNKKVSTNVSKCSFDNLKKSVSVKRKECFKSGKSVGASVYNDSQGYKGSLWNHPMNYAELSNPGTLDFNALGIILNKNKTPLRYLKPLWVKHNGVVLKLLKRDVGRGGGPVRGANGKKYTRRIDLYNAAANKLKIDGLAVVTVYLNNCYAGRQ